MPGPVKIAVAQNADDQYETMLFRLIRGTGSDGLAAIRYERKSDRGFSIIRPLLDVEKNIYLNTARQRAFVRGLTAPTLRRNTPETKSDLS